MNDLITEIQSLKCGVNVNKVDISVLLYADDIALISRSPQGLQSLLNKLTDWCNRWGLYVNDKKTKVVHFRNKSVRKTSYNFMCCTKKLMVVDKYKYLGLWLTEHMDFSYMAKEVAASAHRSLGLLIAKTKTVGGLPYDCYKKLYDSLVQSVLDYGAAIWGHNRFSCIDTVQNRAIRFFLGVHKKTSCSAIKGDMGWVDQYVRQWVVVSKEFCRYSKMEERLNKHVFRWALKSKYKNWSVKCKEVFHNCNVDNLLDIDVISDAGVVKQVEAYLQDEYIQEVWKKDLDRLVSKQRGNQGGNKLRTYRLFKSHYKTEKYVSDVRICYKYRKAFAQVRCSAAPIRVETGRFDHGKYIPWHERICKICSLEVEDESHILLRCPFYEDLHESLVTKAQEFKEDFINLDDVQKLIYLMSDSSIMYHTAKTCWLILNRRKQYFYRN